MLQDRDGAKTLLKRVRKQLPPAAGDLGRWAALPRGGLVHKTCGGFSRPFSDDGAKGNIHLPKRWIVETDFWVVGRYRRLSKDDEANPRSSETWIYLAMIHRMSRRMLPARTPATASTPPCSKKVVFRRPLSRKRRNARIPPCPSGSPAPTR